MKGMQKHKCQRVCQRIPVRRVEMQKNARSASISVASFDALVLSSKQTVDTRAPAAPPKAEWS